MMLPHPSRRAVAPMLILLSLLLSLAVAAPVAAKKNPAGNNGTVKVDSLAFDNHPDNEPHVGCTFEIDFYGFDAGVGNAQAIFEAHAPTGSDHLATRSVDIGQDDNSGGGSAAGWDASIEVDLTAPLQAFTPHAQQGYHVKLTVHAPGSQGADTKHKVFWVAPCAEPENPPKTPPKNPPSNPPGGGGPGTQPPRGGTGGGNPPVIALPDTAADGGATAPLSRLGGALLVGGSVALALVAVRRRSHRRSIER